VDFILTGADEAITPAVIMVRCSYYLHSTRCPKDYLIQRTDRDGGSVKNVHVGRQLKTENRFPKIEMSNVVPIGATGYYEPSALEA